MISILITSGGTLVPIDPVRNISNSSTGHFGATLATAAMKAGMQVNYLAAQNAQSPFSNHVDFQATPDFADVSAKLKTQHEFYLEHHKQYTEHRFLTYDDYAKQLQQLITQQKPQVVVLAAAVSDYLVENYTDEKINSNQPLKIELKPATKLIQQVKQWLPEVFLVGFKLLVNVTDEQLIFAARSSLQKHQLDLCVANDLTSIKKHEHEIILVRKDQSFQKHKIQMANAVIAECLAQVKK